MFGMKMNGQLNMQYQQPQFDVQETGLFVMHTLGLRDSMQSIS